MQTSGVINILEYGAKGDGVTDDTAVIQDAINTLAARGGGKIYFPFTPEGYRIARPAEEFVDGHACRGQLYIPYTPDVRPNIVLEGEMPCSLLYRYLTWFEEEDGRINLYPGGRQPISFPLGQSCNTFLFSDWDAPEETDPAARPWSLICALEGDSCLGRFGAMKVSILNLEFRVKLNREKMYPSMSGANMQNASRLSVRESQFCLDSNIGDAGSMKELQPSPVHTAGLITPGQQNDDVVLDNVASQGFRYGFVLSEHVVANYLYAHNTESAIVFHRCTHFSIIQHMVAQHNQVVISAPEYPVLYGLNCGNQPVYCKIVSMDLEPGGDFSHPKVSNMLYGLWDPQNRMYGELRWHMGFPVNLQYFPVEGGTHMQCRCHYPTEQGESDA